MALLELIKEGTIRINQEEICGDILVFENQESVNQGEGKNE